MAHSEAQPISPTGKLSKEANNLVTLYLVGLEITKYNAPSQHAFGIKDVWIIIN